MRLASCPIPACVLTLALATTSGAGAAELAGSEWRPVEIGNLQVPPGAELFVRFAGEGKLEGHGGCNRFFGSYKIAVDRVEIGPLGATRMACPEGRGDIEIPFLKMLNLVTAYKLDGGTLSLLADEEVLATFEPL